MSKLQFKLNREGVKQLMKSQEMQAVLSKKADEAVQRLGSGYKSDMYVGKNRANSKVFADSNEAKSDNSKNNSILKAVK